MSGVYVNDNPEFSFEETGVLKTLLFPSGCRVTCPVFERLQQKEEERLGNAGIRKSPVGQLELVGECKWGCAQVVLKGMILRRNDGTEVWTWGVDDFS